MTLKYDMEEVMEIEHTFGKGAKKPVDTNAPKRPLSAYFLYSNKVRASVMKDNSDATVSEIGKILGEMWKKISGHERSPYEKKAKAQMDAYYIKKEKYERSSSYHKHQMRLLAWKIHETKKPFKKDENAPKRPLSAYMIYAASVRSKILKENSALTATEVMKEQSVWWKALSDKDREPWNAKAASVKKKYQTKVDRYMKTSDYTNYVTAREEYKKDMLDKRNKLMGIKKRSRSMSRARVSNKKAKRVSRSRSRSRNVRRRSVSTRRRRAARRSRTPKASRRRKARRSRTPKASKSRSSSRRSRTPK